MTVLKVEDMHCDKCVERISSLLKEEEIGFHVSLEKKTVEVEGNEQEVERAIDALDDLGFSTCIIK